MGTAFFYGKEESALHLTIANYSKERNCTMLENLQPNLVFKYFEEICQIPHPSYHCEKISNYLMNFAKEHNLEAYQDDLYNVIIIKEAAEGKEDVDPVMIQGHMDMVAVKDDDADIDLFNDSLKLAIDGDYIYAKGTSLGGDDGIAVAIGLALLADDTLKLPRIELVVTTEEEVGMEGAAGIDLSVCKATRMLNLDSEVEGEFVVSCAGGVRVHANLPVERETIAKEDSFVLCHLTASGFTGGHSGVEIHHHRANANKVLGNVLKELGKQVAFDIISIKGGTKDNAIPVYAEAYLLLSKEEHEKADVLLGDVAKNALAAYTETDPDAKIKLAIDENMEHAAYAENGDLAKIAIMKKNRANEIIDFLCDSPDGVINMCKDLEGLVETSLNLGILDTDYQSVQFDFALRSSVAKEKEVLTKRLCDMVDAHKGTYELAGEYPAWEYKEDSKLRELMVSLYNKQHTEPVKVLSIHAGLECGMLAAKIPGLDCVAFGPNILDIHTTREKLSISSVQRVWKYILEVIEAL